MKALFCYSPEKFLLQDTDIPNINDNQMLIEMLLCGLCGSDIIKIYDPQAKKPAVYGHEVVGRVVRKGKNVSRFDLGDTVVAAHHIPCYHCHYCGHGNYSMCRNFKQTNIYPGGFAQYIRLSEQHIEHTTFRLPEDQPLAPAVFIEPLACCIRAMDRVDIKKEDWFTVVGAGAIGLLFIQLIKLAGCSAIAIDIDEQRLSMAQKLGADAAINPKEEDICRSIRKITGIGPDVAVLTVTNSATVNEAIDYLRDGATINIFGASQKNVTVGINLEQVYKREITIKSTYSSSPQTLKGACNLITSKEIEVNPLLSEIMPLSDFKRGLDLMLSRKVYKPIFKL